MTDARIAELLGWPPERHHHASSLIHRIRRIVVEAQAEQEARIERLRVALLEARDHIREDRDSLAETTRRPDGTRELDDAAALAFIDAGLARIDAAIDAAMECE